MGASGLRTHVVSLKNGHRDAGRRIHSERQQVIPFMLRAERARFEVFETLAVVVMAAILLAILRVVLGDERKV